jgi:hypothetical protein
MNAWENAASADGNPIPGKYWHLTEEENAIREKLRNVDANETGKIASIRIHSIYFILTTFFCCDRMWQDPDHIS